ncbi:MAG: aminotransferase class III-fold pyridoxal phosphate-dependent enzyme [Acidiferrobacterales bacterium]|nr:aminotransferase class III-fold pyridoxal phosphate-dependent enzyme [Acidiferrobacterales bacterium]
MNRSADQVPPKPESIAGGVMSLNRLIDPMRVFVRASGAYMWDDTGKRYIDYHAAFAPYLLGHGDPDVNQAVIDSIIRNESLMGAGTTPWEHEIADLLVDSVPYLEQVQLTNSGTEAVAFSIRLARAATQRNDIVFMQGGYNGWMDSVAFNLMDPSSTFKNHRRGEEHSLRPISAGMHAATPQGAHAVEYNDKEALVPLLESGQIAAVIVEPVLQNIGIVRPQPGYLDFVRELCSRHGTLLIFDEVKTGFRHALGGYQSICNTAPDLSVFGKAAANGYPLGVVGGKAEYMSFCCHPDPTKRVLIAGTYNAHPFVVAAAIATVKKLRDRGDEIYSHLDRLGEKLESGLNDLFSSCDYPTSIVRVGSAFVVYFMDHEPVNWSDIARNNDAQRDVRYRKALIESGVFHFPVTTKQGSISFAHTDSDIDETLSITEKVLAEIG